MRSASASYCEPAKLLAVHADRWLVAGRWWLALVPVAGGHRGHRGQVAGGWLPVAGGRWATGTYRQPTGTSRPPDGTYRPPTGNFRMRPCCLNMSRTNTLFKHVSRTCASQNLRPASIDDFVFISWMDKRVRAALLYERIYGKYHDAILFLDMSHHYVITTSFGYSPVWTEAMA